MPLPKWAIGAGIFGVLACVARRASANTQTVVLTFFDDADDTDTSGAPMTNKPITTVGVQTLAQAIAQAEGFYVPGTVPHRANNPGDLKIPNWTGPVTGREGISVFVSADDGWQRLYRQLGMIRDHRSHVYTTEMTIAEMADKWTDTNADAWATNVVDYLNTHGYDWVTVDTQLGDFLDD